MLSHLISTVTRRPVLISGMKVRLAVFVVASCWSVGLHGQIQPSAKIPFAGCYEIVSQTWHPGNEDASPIPSRSNFARTKIDEAPIFSRCGVSRQAAMTGRDFGCGNPKAIVSGYLGEEAWADFGEPSNSNATANLSVKSKSGATRVANGKDRLPKFGFGRSSAAE